MTWILIFILSITWLAYLLARAGANEKKGECSALFTQQVVQAASAMEPGSKIVIVDLDYRQACSPTKLVFYGFPALLNIHFPGRRFQGKITAPPVEPKMNDYDPGAHYFYWQNGRLTPVRFF